ncbi:MAG: hypothetical protein PHP09_00895 [Bacilli bacterium]|nr:hypothetical protein [Bacilli bacterium]
MRLKNLSTNQKIVLLALVIYILGALVFGLLLLIPTGSDLLLGWLLGAAISFACFGLLVLQAYVLTSENAKGAGFVMLFFAGRFILYGAGLFVAAFLTYKLEIHIFNLFTVFGGYFPIRLAIYLFGFLDKRKQSPTPQTKELK